MSNRDCNGYELPWILVTEPYVKKGYAGHRSRIATNPAHEDAAHIDDSWALAMALVDAIQHRQLTAMVAVAAHIRDAHKF